MESAVMEMPRYRSHKLVWALKIKEVSQTTPGAVMLLFEDESYAAKEVSVVNRPSPEAGWYYVVYEDDYHSFSPAPQFEKGNVPYYSTLEQAAKTAHEANRILCQALGDDSQPKWDDAPQWQKDSAIAGVRQILRDPRTTPKQSHAGWLAQKQADGWKYGPVKDPEKKEHPCFVPYEELPAQQRLKDYMFGIAVRGVLFL